MNHPPIKIERKHTDRFRSDRSDSKAGIHGEIANSWNIFPTKIHINK